MNGEQVFNIASFLILIGYLFYLIKKVIPETLDRWDMSVKRTANEFGNMAKGVVSELESTTKRVCSHSATEAEKVLDRVAEKAKDPTVKETVAHLAVIAASAAVVGLLIAESEQQSQKQRRR